jgi:hypothetical protein
MVRALLDIVRVLDVFMVCLEHFQYINNLLQLTVFNSDCYPYSTP